MCQRVTCDTCDTCGKPTYEGCGRHVEQVLGTVPVERRCTCEPATATATATGTGVLGRLGAMLRR